MAQIHTLCSVALGAGELLFAIMGTDRKMTSQVDITLRIVRARGPNPTGRYNLHTIKSVS